VPLSLNSNFTTAGRTQAGISLALLVTLVVPSYYLLKRFYGYSLGKR
jgi:hypothetical protein